MCWDGTTWAKATANKVAALSPIVGIVQARMGSTRFPGKMLADLNGYPLIRWVLERTSRSRNLDAVVLATTDLPRDDILADMAAGMGIAVFRGDEEDVLGRFVGAANLMNAATVVRICADRPLIAPEMIDLAIVAYKDGNPDYAYNHIPGHGQRPPYGLGAEVLSAALLKKLDDMSTEAHQREHVTYYIWDHPGDFSILAADCPPACDTGDAGLRFDVDTEADLDHLKRLGPGIHFDTPATDLVATGIRRDLTRHA